VHIVLGDPQDPWCISVRDALDARGCRTVVIANPLAHPSLFQWNLTNERSVSQVADEGGAATADEQIAGVFVRNSACIDPDDWEPADLAYMQAETQAALLGWLWSLPCPVVNRYPSAIWYRPRAPLLSWFPLFHRCGLAITETLVTNVEQEARAFGRRLVAEEMGGAIYGPLTGEAQYVGELAWA
jgi:hypothetical protein